MARSRNTFTALLILILALLALIAFAVAVSPADTGGAADARYHEQFGTHSGSDRVGGHDKALPAAQDPASAGVMARSADVMIHVADSMGALTPTLLENGDAPTKVLAQHWNLDAHALRDRATWMVTSATSDAMIHNPDNVTEVNLSNLRGNGLAMIDEGQAMASHGAQMRTEVEQLQRDGVLSSDVADHLLDQADALSDVGRALERDGESMRDTAENLLRSIGR
jgi:hypothetical protein